MNYTDRFQTVVPCGYCCLSCPDYEHTLCTDEVAIAKEAKRANREIHEMGTCKGCREKEGMPHGNILCQTYDCCVNKKGLDFCYECEDFPCAKFAPMSEKGDIRRHNTKIYCLLMLKKLGLDEYVKRSLELSIQWARGKNAGLGGNVYIEE